LHEPGYRKGVAPANKGQHYKKTPPTLEEAHAIIEALKRPGQTLKHERLGQRNAALAATLHRSGLRIHEGLLLKPGDVDFEKHVVHVRRGKGGKERWSIIDDFALGEIRTWLDMREVLGFTDEDFLFCVIEGPTRGGMLHQPYVRTKLKEAAALAGVEKRVCCHQWRHAHARHLRKMGVSWRPSSSSSATPTSRRRASTSRSWSRRHRGRGAPGVGPGLD
jgi:site-specific recombinase XerD